MTFSVVLCINYADTPRENHELRTENTIVLIYIYIHGDATRFNKSTSKNTVELNEK